VFQATEYNFRQYCKLSTISVFSLDSNQATEYNFRQCCTEIVQIVLSLQYWRKLYSVAWNTFHPGFRNSLRKVQSHACVNELHWLFANLSIFCVPGAWWDRRIFEPFSIRRAPHGACHIASKVRLNYCTKPITTTPKQRDASPLTQILISQTKPQHETKPLHRHAWRLPQILNNQCPSIFTLQSHYIEDFWECVAATPPKSD
jgi:hypothetical protein